MENHAPQCDIPSQICSNSARLDFMVDHIESHQKSGGEISKRKAGAQISEEELKIRNELEMDIEKDLEKEIKDGIYDLAHRLHRLYLTRKERNAKRCSSLKDTPKRNKAATEVNLSIKMEGGTSIEIKEIKKEARDREKLRSMIRDFSAEKNKQLQGGGLPPKRFDWVKSLRSGSQI
ncbi:hypothetical protein Ancab_026273 [Ancistrocladus abbreviatus]